LYAVDWLGTGLSGEGQARPAGRRHELLLLPRLP
jgi:hypothetical protein